MRQGSERFSWWGFIVIAATIAVVGGIVYQYSRWPPPPSVTTTAVAQNEEPSQPPSTTPRPVRVALLTDSPPADDSWFEQAMTSKSMSGYEEGAVVQGSGANTAALVPLVERARKATWVVVQGGASDLVAGLTPEDAVANVISVIEAAREAGYEVVWATTAPLSNYPTAVLAINDEVTRWAQRNDVPVLDLFGAVGDTDGTYLDGFSDDGVEPNGSALKAQARAARRQLPDLLAATQPTSP